MVAGLLLSIGIASGCTKGEGGGPHISEPPVTDEIERVDVSFNHPCAYVSAADLDRARAAIAGADPTDPVYCSWLHLCQSPYAQDSWTARPVETLVRGDARGTGVDKENYIVCDQDAAAAFELALRWRLSGDERYARSAVRILNAWASVCKRITANDNNQYLLAGFQGHTFANAAELLRDYSGWQSVDQDAFKRWLKEVFYQKNFWFLSTHGGEGNCPLHYWSNWELANMASMMAIGIYLEDRDMISFVSHQFYKGEGSGALHHMIPYAPVSDPDGRSGLLTQSMESGRDQGHATLVVSMCAELCQMAGNVGLDFWGAEDNLVLSMCEYTAKYNVQPGGQYLCTDMPFTQYKYCMDCSCINQSHGAVHNRVSSASRGTIRPCWELICAQYGSRAYYSGLFAEQLRYVDGALTGDGGAGDSRYGSKSGAFDQLGWGTLLFYAPNKNH